MKILRLQSSNIMKLVAVDITPTGDVVIVGGKNGAGKSSVLNSIAMALGGATMCPQEPIRAGESEAKIEVDLGDLRVTRRFSRAKEPALPGEVATLDWGPTTSTLAVTNKDGARYPSPQAMLDKLLGKLTFDPLKFKDLDPKTQDAELRKLVGLDVSEIEGRRKAAFDQRAMLKKTLAIKEAQIVALVKYDGVPGTEVPLADITNEMAKAEEYKRLADDARLEAERAGDAMRIAHDSVTRAERVLEEAKRQVTIAEAALRNVGTSYDTAVKNHDACKITADAALAVVPDVVALRTKLSEAVATNAKVRANAKYKDALAEVAILVDQVSDQNEIIESTDEEKLTVLQAAKFPVAGLSLSDNGVTFGGLPFTQASTSEQLRVSVAIGLALNPTLKVLLIRNGNMLDGDSLKTVAAQAEAAGAQVWVEWVTANADGMSVMIEDGKVQQ